MHYWTDDEVQILKQIWAIMVHKGRPTDPNAEWSIYRGDYEDKSWNYDEVKQQTDYRRFEIKQFDVDWYNTDVPEYECQSEFNDSESPCSDVHVWHGWMQLKNGQRQYWSAIDIDLRPLVERFALQDEEVDLVGLYFGR